MRRNGQFIANDPGDLRVLNRGPYEGCLTNYCSGAYADTKSIPKVKGQLWVGMAGTLRSLKFPSNCSHVRLLVFGSHALDAVCRFCFEMGQHSMTAKGRPTF